MAGRPVGMRALAGPLCALALLSGLPAAARAQAPPPDLHRAAAAILVDARDGAPILRKDSSERRQIASTTKLMTALLTLERARPGQVFTAPRYRALAAESKINLRPGERMRVDDLFEALLLESANDAAVTLAQGIAGSREAFVRAMNERAAQLGLRDTSYANPVGLDDPRNYSSARDLAVLARHLLADPRFARVVDMPSAVLESGARRRVVRNRNDLVGRYAFVTGVKTGHTGTAGYVLVGSARGRLGARVISVVLGEPGEGARDADSLALLGYGLAQFRRRRVLDDSRAVASAAVKHRDERIGLVPAHDVLVLARRGQRVSTRVDAPRELEGEQPAGARAGRVSVLRDGRVVERVELVTSRRVPGAGPLRVVSHALGLPLTLLLLLVIVSLVALGGRRAWGRRRDRDREERRRTRAGPESSTAEP